MRHLPLGAAALVAIAGFVSAALVGCAAQPDNETANAVASSTAAASSRTTPTASALDPTTPNAPDPATTGAPGRSEAEIPGESTADNRSTDQRCADPTGPTVKRGYLRSMPTGTVLPDPLPVLDGVTLPAMSIYIGGGPAGQGLLCQTGAADRPLIDATAPEDRPIAYFSVAIGGVGAVRPDVAKVMLTTLSVREVFTPTRQGSTDATLLDLGGGWHTFASDTLFVGGDPPGSPASVAAVAYDSHGAEVDRRTLQMPTVG